MEKNGPKQTREGGPETESRKGIKERRNEMKAKRMRM
jgi:hypothetical protein